PTKENAPAQNHLYVYDRSSGTSTALVTNFSAGNIKFRPGGNNITFTARREGDKFAALYELPAGGGEPQKLYEFEASISSYDWHPKGSQIAFISQQSKVKNENQLPYQPEIYETDLQNNSAFIVDLNSKTPRTLEVKGHVSAVQWNPQGSNLAVSSAPSSLVDDSFTSQRIYIVDANSGKVTGEIDHKAKLGPLAWSPDGKRLAFIAGEDQHDPIDGSILISEVAGGSSTIL